MPHTSLTKDLIFDAFLQQTSSLGYENVGLRDIGKLVNINAASIYYHFPSKEAILDHAYNYYLQHQFDNRLQRQEMYELVETAAAEKIVDAFFYSFDSTDEKYYTRMVLITRIIYMRLFQDRKASDIFNAADIDNHDYVVDILNHGKEIGRIDKNFDTDTYAYVLIGSMQIMGIKAFADVNYKVGQLDRESRILALLTRLLSTALLDPPE